MVVLFGLAACSSSSPAPGVDASSPDGLVVPSGAATITWTVDDPAGSRVYLVDVDTPTAIIDVSAPRERDRRALARAEPRWVRVRAVGAHHG